MASTVLFFVSGETHVVTTPIPDVLEGIAKASKLKDAGLVELDTTSGKVYVRGDHITHIKQAAGS